MGVTVAAVVDELFVVSAEKEEAKSSGSY